MMLDDILDEYRAYLLTRYIPRTAQKYVRISREICLDCGDVDMMLATDLDALPIRTRTYSTRSVVRCAARDFRDWWRHVHCAEVPA